jgi:hypothetical protein
LASVFVGKHVAHVPADAWVNAFRHEQGVPKFAELAAQVRRQTRETLPYFGKLSWTKQDEDNQQNEQQMRGLEQA